MRSRESGKKWEVDHIIPIAGDSVCGLHVPWNLRVVTMQENRSKSNKLISA
jgi:5-methylcytosine-specific restriction endonuclease McrA